jgi:signal transduction histidine kinase/ActR/RegA family two-component response regulator
VSSPLRRWLATRLSHRVAFWAGAMTLLTLLAGMGIAVAGALWADRRQFEADVEQHARDVAGEVATRLQEVAAGAAALSRSRLVATGLSDSAGRDEYLRPLLGDSVVRQKYAAGLRLCDAFGRIVTAAPEPSPAATAAPGHDPRCGSAVAYERALASGAGSAAVLDADDALRLVWIEPVRLPATGTHEGAVVVEIAAPQLLRPALGSALDGVTLLPASRSTTADHVRQDDRMRSVDRAVAAAPSSGLADQPLMVRVAVALPGDRGIRATVVLGYLGATLVLSVLAAVAAAALARRLAGPLMELGRIADGPRGADPAAWSGLAARPDEIGEVAGHLQRMAERLAEHARTQADARAAADAANRAKTEFLATISHEIRTPLNAVVGLADLALDAEGDEQRGHLAQTRRSAQHLVGLVNDVLDLTRIESGRFDLADEPHSPGAVAREVHAALEPAARAKGLAFEVHVDALLPEAVRGDALRLHQVLTNLVSNAIKFTDAGRVRLTLSRQAGTDATDGAELLRIVVEDDGVGIPPEQQALVFEAFRQADAGTTRRHGGTGLGLAITRRLVAMMGGRIALDSRPGRGTRFSVDLPLRRAAQPPPAAAAAGPGDAERVRAALGARAVLVVDDDATNLMLAGHVLRRHGVRAVPVATGREAVALLAAPHDIGAVLLDCHMPDMDGFAVTRAIRDTLGLHDLPIVACTADVLTEDRDSCVAAGMDDYVSKPIERQALFAAFARALRLTDPA